MRKPAMDRASAPCESFAKVANESANAQADIRAIRKASQAFANGQTRMDRAFSQDSQLSQPPLSEGDDVTAVEPFEPAITPPSAPLSAEEEAAIRAWLALIGETDPATVAEVIDRCRKDGGMRGATPKLSACGTSSTRPERPLKRLSKPEERTLNERSTNAQRTLNERSANAQRTLSYQHQHQHQHQHQKKIYARKACVIARARRASLVR